MTRAADNPTRARVGFTLVEVLITMLVVTLLTAMVASAIPSAMRAYNSAVNGSNARVALSTTTTALRDELGMATDVTVDAANALTGYTDGRGRACTLANADASGAAQMGTGIQKTITTSDGTTTSSLIPDAAITSDLGVVYESITYEDGRFTVGGLEVRDKDQNVLASVGDDGYIILAMGVST